MPESDWRARLAGGDAKLLGYLARIPSEQALVAQLKQHNDDLKAGRLLKTLPDDPGPDDLADWRRARGVPDAPEGYLETLPEGLVVGAEDRPHVDRFLAEMHRVHAPPGAVNAALDAYYAIVEDQCVAELELADAARAETAAALRAEWGGDYPRRLNAVRALLDTLPEEVAEAFRNGRGPDGLPLANSAGLIRWLAELAAERSPPATLAPGTAATQASAIAAEMAALEAKMGDSRSDYWKGPNAAALQARYVELAAAQGRLGG